MRRNVELYINNQRVELFDFVDINIVDTIQDVRDISKVFVPYSKEFTVPASKTNNRIFRHYYNQNITDGFDARYKISAVIKLNGAVYKKGKVALMGSTLKNDKPYSYKLVFFDRTVDLKEIIGDDMLSDLNSGYLDRYNIEYNYTNVFQGLMVGWSYSGGVMQSTSSIDPQDLIFPFISTNNYYYYDSVAGNPSPTENNVESRNIHADETNTPRGINYRDLRGGIRVPIIFDAIQDQYEDINFTGSFLEESNEEFNKLYLYLMKEKGLYEAKRSNEFLLTDATESGGSSLIPLTTYEDSQRVTYEVRVTVTPSETNDDYNFKAIRTENNSTVYSSNGTGEVTFDFELKSEDEKTWDLKFVTSEYNSVDMDYSIWIRKKTLGGVTPSNVFDVRTYTYSDTSTSETYSLANNMPKIKIIDFLTSIFKMFNLTAYTDSNGDIVIQTLDDFYSSGNLYDVSKYVDTSNKEVSKNKLFSEIRFEYEETSTFAALNSNEITGDTFGNEIIEDVNDDQYLRELLAFDGGTYEIKPKFEKVMYERMSDQTTSDITSVGWGWLVDKDTNPVLAKPLLFYAENVNLADGTSGNITLDYLTGYLFANKYFRPSNSLSSSILHGQSLNFGSEFDEFHFSLGENRRSLFITYWVNYIKGIYDKKSRIVSLTCHLPSYLVLGIRLNDELVIRGNRYFINKIETNLNTGKTKLELITKWEISTLEQILADSQDITSDTNAITADNS